MNYIGHSFHFQQGDELCFNSQFIPLSQQPQQQQPPPPPHQPLHQALVGPGGGIGFQPSSRRKLASNSMAGNDGDGEELDDKINNKKKKIIHRDVERQRRHEMAMLYASLRFLLPIEYLKGKRSISDHMNEAANYIKNLQKKIKELTEKRDGLKRVVLGGLVDGCLEEGASTRPTQVVVRPSWAGAEVVISAASAEGLPLSEVLGMLMDAGLTVINCTSNNLHAMVVYTIQCEARDMNEVDLNELQHKITESFCLSR